MQHSTVEPEDLHRLPIERRREVAMKISEVVKETRDANRQANGNIANRTDPPARSRGFIGPMRWRGRWKSLIHEAARSFANCPSEI